MKPTKIYESIEEIDAAKNKLRVPSLVVLIVTMLLVVAVAITGNLVGVLAVTLLLIMWLDLQAEKHSLNGMAHIIANRVVLVQAPNEEQEQVITEEQQQRNAEIAKLEEYLQTLKEQQQNGNEPNKQQPNPPSKPRGRPSKV